MSMVMSMWMWMSPIYVLSECHLYLSTSKVFSVYLILVSSFLDPRAAPWQLENTWHDFRDHSFIKNQSSHFRLPAPCWCFFSSVHPNHFLQRKGMAISEVWFCDQWPIFVLFLRFVFGLLSGWKIQTWPIIRFLTESVTYWFFTCWYLIQSMMSFV